MGALKCGESSGSVPNFLHTVGWYLSGAALLTLCALWGARETRDALA